MNRRSLFKGLAATIAAVPFAGMVVKSYASDKLCQTGENGPELHIQSANVGMIQAGRISNHDRSFTIDLSARRIQISA